jgi:hypothetical protein
MTVVKISQKIQKSREERTVPCRRDMHDMTWIQHDTAIKRIVSQPDSLGRDEIQHKQQAHIDTISNKAEKPNNYQ